ncbi:hypothetical protein D3C77_692050 [compost metagenome]
MNTAFISLLRLMQTIRVGGVSVTEHTAVAVMPQRPASPSVVMMFTAALMCAMALRKASCLGSSCWDMFATPGARWKARDGSRGRRHRWRMLSNAWLPQC